MNAETRRAELTQVIKAAGGRPVSATALADRFSVSRQVIVGDIAILRAAGEDIEATPRGYVMKRDPGGLHRTIACVHNSDEMADELNIIVDNGCTVVDVVVEHPLYGQLTGQLSLASRFDVSRFVKNCREQEAQPLSSLTGGVHLHHLRCPDEAAYERVKRALVEAGFLFRDN